MRTARHGFVLLEVLPALVLFWLALCLTHRYLRLSTEAALGGEQARYREQAQEMAVALWSDDPGEVALARRSETGIWEVHTFPDESWIPIVDPSAGRQMRSVSETLVLRRKNRGGHRWEISERRIQPDGEAVWIVLKTVTRVMNFHDETD